jgi:ATP diphosphatase
MGGAEERRARWPRGNRDLGRNSGRPPCPALAHAAKLTIRAARVGFDWPDVEAVLHKLDEEIAELRAELPEGRRARLADEVGDLLFVLANLARKLDLDAEACLRQANLKFLKRFDAMEQAAASTGSALAELTLADMEALWAKIKADQEIIGQN